MTTMAERCKQEGLQKGLQVGRQEGLQKGRQIGRKKTLRAVIIKLFILGLPLEQILLITGLSAQEIESTLN